LGGHASPLIKAHIDTHSFSHFLPGLTHFMDLPDMLGAFVPNPLLVLQCSKDVFIRWKA
jgi:hypothetical protein